MLLQVESCNLGALILKEFKTIVHWLLFLKAVFIVRLIKIKIKD